MFFPLKWLLGRVAAAQARSMRKKFHQLTQRPREVQHRRLFEQIQRESATQFGKDHHFAQIRTLADFRRQLPISKYEYYAPYIEKVKNGDFEAMFHNQKILMFAMTSGTTATRKFIPVTKRFLNDYRRGWMIWGLHMFEAHRELWFQSILQLTSDWDEFRTPAGVPCGSISGLTTQMQKYVVRKTYLLPPSAGKIKDVRAKFYLAWRLGLARGVKVVLSANPSTIVNLGRFGDENRDVLLRDIRNGTIDQAFALPDSVRNAIRKHLVPNPSLTKKIEEVIQRTGRLLPKDVWGLGIIGNWTGGSVGAYMRHYPELYGQPTIRDLGLVASEGRMTIPTRDFTSGGILDVSSSFFEFIPAGEIDSPNPTVLESHELKEGSDYFILLTTSSGLYRYNIYDVVRCVGWSEKTPILTFLNKGSNFSNLTGEKLSEFQVVQAIDQAMQDCDVRLCAFTLAPLWDDRLPFYGLFVERPDFASDAKAKQMADAVEKRLREQNSEYQEKRDTLRLGPIRLQFLPGGTWRDWDRARLARTGGTAEQYKHPALIPDTEFAKTMPVLPAE